MKFDPSNWYQFAPGDVVLVSTSMVRVKTSAPSALFVHVLPDEDEVEPPLPFFVLAGFGTEFDFEVGPGGPVEFRITSSQKDCVGFHQGEVYDTRPARLGSFTNVDRPFSMESEAYDAVYGAVRQLQYEMRQQALLNQREGRAQARINDALARAREAEAKVDLEPAKEPVKEPEKEP